LDEAILKELNNRLTIVIHNAWALQRLGIRSFKSHYIKGTFNPLNLYLSVETTNPARLFFCSSILAVAGTPLPATILETHIEAISSTMHRLCAFKISHGEYHLGCMDKDRYDCEGVTPRPNCRRHPARFIEYNRSHPINDPERHNYRRITGVRRGEPSRSSLKTRAK